LTLKPNDSFEDEKENAPDVRKKVVTPSKNIPQNVEAFYEVDKTMDRSLRSDKAVVRFLF